MEKQAVAEYETGTEVAPSNGGPPAVYEKVEVLGMDEIDRSDIALPRVRIRQLQSKFGEDEDAGKLHNSITEEFKDEVRAIVFRISKGRVMWPEEFGGENEPECASDDNRVPRQGNGLTNIQPGPCDQCEFTEWGSDGEPPRCSLTYTYLCCDRDEDDMPFLISAMRTSAKAAKKLNTLIGMWGIRREFTIQTRKVVDDKGKWHELVFKSGSRLEPDEMQHYKEMRDSLADLVVTVDTENTTGVEDLDEGDFAEPDAGTVIDGEVEQLGF